MELPKNITQIGESDKHCKIYVEDYVVSYIKQTNQLARDKDMAVALYGRRRVEGEIVYLFIYGASKLDFLQRETRHLSQAQLQEIEKLRRKYFPDYDFQGYRLLNGEMVEGFHICEQQICRYISGYAQFYEKNEGMLAYMLDVRTAEAAPEVVDREKYDVVKKRQEERKEESHDREKLRSESWSLRRMKLSTAAVFVLLGLAGMSLIADEQNREDLQAAAMQAMTELTEQKLPDAEGIVEESAEAVASTLVVEDKLTEAVWGENEVVTSSEGTEIPITTIQPVTTEAPVTTPQPTVTDVPTAAPQTTTTLQPIETPQATATPVSAPAYVTYTIQAGDTLIGLSTARYGTEAKVKEICEVNKITNPDNIKVGQEILLPYE